MNENIPNQDKPKRFKIISRNALIRLSVLLLFILLAGYYMFSMPGNSYRGKDYQPADAKLADELKQYVTKLAGDIGERNLFNVNKLNQAADYIEKQFNEAGYTAKRQSYQVDNITVYNLIVELTGQTTPQEIVVIGAHYDSAYNCPGANDNATGIAATLALAKRFANNPQPRTIRFVAFVNEEPPYFQTPTMGSYVYAKNCRQNNDQIVAMISLETIGYYTDQPNTQKYPPPLNLLYPSTGNFIGFVGNLESRNLVHRSIASFRKHAKFPSEGVAMPGVVTGVGWSDHWSFWEHGYNGIMITDTAPFRYPHYHETTDTPDKIDYTRMATVVAGLENVITDLATEN